VEYNDTQAANHDGCLRVGLLGRRNWDAKRKRRVQKGVRPQDRSTWGPVEGKQEEGGEVTQYDVIMHQFIAHDPNDPTLFLAFFPSSCLSRTFIGSSEMNFFHNLISFPNFFKVFAQFGLSLSCT